LQADPKDRATNDMNNEERKCAVVNARCIVCGAENVNGLQLEFGSEVGVASADWRPSTQWEGFRGVIHGGIVSTVLDEAMSQAIIAQGWEAFTAELRVRLRRRISPREPLRVSGWVMTRRKREIWAEATLEDAAGVERAHAWAKFLEPLARGPEKQQPPISQRAGGSVSRHRRPGA
jgi:acyl-coenzyme A thioesterase PaaI-like protein